MKKLKLDDVAKDYGVTRRTVERWIHDGDIESVKIGGTRRVLSDDVEKKNDNCRQSPTITDKTNN